MLLHQVAATRLLEGGEVAGHDLLPQGELLDLAGTGERKGVDREPARRDLLAGELRLAVGRQRLHRRTVLPLDPHHRSDDLAPQ